MTKTVLPFKLGSTQEKITAHAGLALFGEFIQAMNVPNQVDMHLPAPGSCRGYAPSRFVEPLVLMLHGGGRCLEDLRQIRQDHGLCKILRLEQFPSSDATGDWLRRMGHGKGLDGLRLVNRLQLRRALNLDKNKEYTLDIDATQVIAEKYEAKFTYKGERGYMPMVGHLAENGLVLGDEFREGNEAPASRNLEFIKYCSRQLPKGKRIAHLRADSATYQASVVNWCTSCGVSFAIGASLDFAVMKAIEQIAETDWQEYGDSMIAETVHSMQHTKEAFRLIVIKRPYQLSVHEGIESASCQRYTVIASNREESAVETVRWYNRRGETSENRLKELKLGFSMERMPCGTIEANAVFFRIGVLSYNLYVLFKLYALPESWRKHQIQTVRWRLYQSAGKVVKHAGAVFLKVAEDMYNLFAEVRSRCYELKLCC